MRVAGVRLIAGDMVWLDAGSLALRSLDRVVAHLPDGDVPGEVFVTPEDLISFSAESQGCVLESHAPSQPVDDCSTLPGSEFPVLGRRVRSGAVSGTVVALEVVARRVTIAVEGAEESTVALEDITVE